MRNGRVKRSVSTCPKTSSWAVVAAPLLIVACGLGAYFNSFGGAFIFDDLPWIVDNPSIRHLWPPWDAMGRTLRPLLFYTLAINYAISGLEVWSYHAVNLAIHILAALTLYGLVRRTLLLESLRERYAQSARWLAPAAALIWLVHPLQTQSVTYIIQRGESLMGLFYLLTLYYAVRGARSGHAWRWYVAAFIAHSCGLGAKEIMVTCLPVLFLFDVALLSGSIGRAIRKRWALYVAMAAPGLIFLGPSIVRDPAPYFSLRFDVEAVAPLQYAQSQPGVILHYLKLAFWPAPLCFDYDWPVAKGWGEVAPPTIVIGLLLLGTIWALWHRWAWGFVAAAFFLILLPTSSIMPIRDLAVEHRMYLPLAVVVVLTLGCGEHLLRRLIVQPRTRTRLAVGAVGVMVVACGYLTYERNADYHSANSIWSSVIAAHPENARAHNNLGATWAAQGEFEWAKACYLQALQLRPDYAEAHNNLGVAMLHQGQLEEALAHYREALTIKPTYADAHVNVGMALARQGNMEQARASYAEALRHNNNLPVAHNNLGTTWEKQGDLARAAACYAEALRLDDRYAMAHVNLANILLKGGKPEEAIAHYRTALRIDPMFVPACNNLGTALMSVGRKEEALAQFRRALQLQPNDINARENLHKAQQNPR